MFSICEPQMVRHWKDILGECHYRLPLFLYYSLLTFLFAGVESRPLVSPICFFLCAYVSGGEFSSCNIRLVDEGKWFSVPHSEKEYSY